MDKQHILTASSVTPPLLHSRYFSSSLTPWTQLSLRSSSVSPCSVITKMSRFIWLSSFLEFSKFILQATQDISTCPLFIHARQLYSSYSLCMYLDLFCNRITSVARRTVNCLIPQIHVVTKIKFKQRKFRLYFKLILTLRVYVRPKVAHSYSNFLLQK